MSVSGSEIELLIYLQGIPGPSGDEGAIADECVRRAEAIPGVAVSRVGDLVVAQKGSPKVAVLAHIDTVGFTLAYDRALYRIGGPNAEGGEELAEVQGDGRARLKVRSKDEHTTYSLSGRKGAPGSRWVYAAPLQVRKDRVRGPYLDNRAGVWNALRVLESATDVAVYFTPGEEHSGKGAAIAARMLYAEGIRKAIISDITWHTASIKCGRGPAISLRDRSVPRRRFLDEVLAAAFASGLPFQVEVESAGGSDGTTLESSSYPIDWVFVGAPQKRPHTVTEECHLCDLAGMTDLTLALVDRLGAQTNQSGDSR